MRICFFTGTRAEYGLLQPLIERMRETPGFDVKLLVSGTHLSPEFGMTVSQIVEQESLERVEMLLSSDSPIGVAKSFGLGVVGYADALARIKPNWCIVAGDRSEALACAITCVMLSIPVAHLHGGETSEGSLDEYYRHAITKLSRLHFTSTEEYRRRVIQMGESPATVHNVGAIGLDNLSAMTFLTRGELEVSLGFRFRKHNLLVTIHPEHGLSTETLRQRMEKVLEAIGALSDTMTIFTMSNSDANGRLLNSLIAEFVSIRKERSILVESLGSLRYFSLMRHVDAVVGNSSSGLIEAPSLGVPTINIGGRQNGRIRAASVIDCTEESLSRVLKSCLRDDNKSRFAGIPNPYGDGKTASRIIQVLGVVQIEEAVKKFYDQGTNDEQN